MYCCWTRKSHPRTRIICQKRNENRNPVITNTIDHRFRKAKCLSVIFFNIFNIYVLGAQKNRLIDMALLSTHKYVLVEK